MRGSRQGPDLAGIRKRSIAACKKLGYATNPHLPLLDVSLKPRSAAKVAARICCLVAVICVAFGYDPKLARSWLRRAGFQAHLADSEVAFLKEAGDVVDMRLAVDALFALAWAAQLMPELDFAKETPKTLINSLPHPKVWGSITKFVRQKLLLRPKDELLAATDLAYCIHWAIQDSIVGGRLPPGPPDHLHPVFIIQRRRGLEWLVSNCDWDETPMDT